MAIVDTLTSKAGPLPVWAWAGLGTAGLAGFMYYRQKKNAAAAAAAQQADSQGVSSNLGTTPISNLTTAAQPMPIQMGDTFVNVPTTTSSSSSTTTNNPAPQSQSPSMTLTAAQMNTLIHTPPTWAGQTGVSWSKLTPAQKENTLIHTPAPGYSGIAWSQMPLASRLNDWVQALKTKAPAKK